jgi:hypothetical protein
MKKWFWIGIGVLVLIIAILVFTVSHLGPIIKTAVNSEGPKITKTAVHVDRVGVSLLSGEADLKGLLIGNPQGFSAPAAVKVGSVRVDVDKKSLTGNLVVINKIEVASPDITYERNKQTDNFQAILDNVNRTAGGGKARPTQTPSSGKKLLIRDFVVKNGRVSLYIGPGHVVTVDLPDIQLKNIGGQDNGVPPARAAQEILAAVYRDIQSPDVLNSLKAQLGKLNVRVNGSDLKSLSDTLTHEAGGIGEKLKGLIGNP